MIFKVSNDGKLNLFGKNISDLINSITDLSDAFKDEGVSSLKAFKDAMDKAGASAKANQLVMKGLSVALNSLTYAAILKVIDLVITAFDNFIHRVEHAQEALENANSTYESTQSELSSITSELEEQEKVLSDLQSKEKLTYAEQGQLEELQQITAELQLQQDILEKQASREREDVANAAVKAFNTQYGKANLTDVDENQDRFWTLDSTDANIADVISDYLFAQKQLDNVKKQIQESERELSDSELEYLEYQFQHFTDLIDEYEYGLESHLATLEDYKQSLAESYNENILKQQNSETLTTNQQDVINTYQAIADAMRLIYQYTDPNQWNSMQISDVFATEGIEKTKDELIEMAKAGELTPETISGYKNLNSAIQQSGLFLEDGQTAAEAFVNEIYAAAEAEKKLNDGASEVANTTATISSSVSQIATQLKPQFDELAEAYKEIFSDDGFSIDVVDNEMLENLRSAFEDIEEDVGVSFDTTELNKFFSVLTDGASTADEVQQAFNDLATAYLYSTDTMENLNDETAAAIEQQLQEMGVTNANEVVSAALAQQKLNLGVANLYAAQTGGSLATATAEEIVNFAAEQIEMGNLSQEMAQLLLQKASLNLTTIDTEADINNLIALAETAGATAQTLNVLNAAKGRFGSTNSDSLDALRARKDLALGINNAPELNFDYEPVKLDFDGAYAGSKDAAGKAGKEAADEYKEQFEKELDDLQSLHDRGR